MDNIRAKIAAARDIAASREGDIRIKELLRAITMSQDVGAAAVPTTLEISCHFRSWQKSIDALEAASLDAMSQTELADAIAGWVQDAINRNLLSLSDPPRAVGKEAFSVGGIVTFVYDRDCMLVGKRWN